MASPKKPPANTGKPSPRKPARKASGVKQAPATAAAALKRKPELKAPQGPDDTAKNSPQETVAMSLKKSGKADAKDAEKKKKPMQQAQGKAKAGPAAAAKGKSKEAKEKPKKAKLVRDSFTMPENEYQAIGDIKKTCIKSGFAIKKSEVLRIGVALLRKMSASQIQEALSALPALKAGRPKKDASGISASQ